jgi:hypothetical protein
MFDALSSPKAGIATGKNGADQTYGTLAARRLHLRRGHPGRGRDPLPSGARPPAISPSSTWWARANDEGHQSGALRQQPHARTHPAPAGGIPFTPIAQDWAHPRPPPGGPGRSSPAPVIDIDVAGGHRQEEIPGARRPRMQTSRRSTRRAGRRALRRKGLVIGKGKKKHFLTTVDPSCAGLRLLQESCPKDVYYTIGGHEPQGNSTWCRAHGKLHRLSSCHMLCPTSP